MRHRGMMQDRGYQLLHGAHRRIPTRGYSFPFSLRRSRAIDAVTVDLAPLQWEIYDDMRRFRIVVAGRRSGKTVEAITECVTASMTGPKGLVYYIAPTYRMARDIAWETALQMIDRRYLRKPPNESRLEFAFKNGSTFALRGAEKPDRLVGRGLKFACFDEWAQMKERVWTQIVLPMLATTQGRALFITTPAGFNHAYKMFTRAQQPKHARTWGYYQFTTADGGWVPADELLIAQGEVDPRIYRQEYEASFETMIGRVYSNFKRLTHRTTNAIDPVDASILIQEKLRLKEIQLPPVWIGMDFNVNPMTAVMGNVKNHRQLDIFDEAWLIDSNTAEMSKEIRERYGDKRPVIACPDPSGQSRHTNAPLGETDLTILERAGFEISVPPAAPRVVDRINAVQALLRNARNQINLKVHPRAEHLIEALEGLTYKEGTSRPDPKSPHIHICLTGDTLITTARGLIPIRDVQVGDYALTRRGFHRVTAAWQTTPDAPILKVRTTEGHVLRGTADHPIWVEGSGWTPLNALSYGVRLLAAGHVAHVSEVSEAGRAPVYNLTVESEHEYFANGLLVSNCDALGYLVWQECNPLRHATWIVKPVRL